VFSLGVSSAIVLLPGSLGIDFALVRDRQCPRDLALGALETGGVVKLAGGVLEAQSEQLTASGADVLGQLTLGHVAKL
jgi:hypothetical protein